MRVKTVVLNPLLPLSLSWVCVSCFFGVVCFHILLSSEYSHLPHLTPFFFILNSPSHPTLPSPHNFSFLLAFLVLHLDSRMVYFVCFLNFPPLPFFYSFVVDVLVSLPSASVLSPKAFLGPHRLLFLFICLSRAGKEEATAGRQGHSGRRGPGSLRILPELRCPWKKGFLLERGLGLCCSPPVRLDVACQAPAEGWGQMVFPPRCVGRSPISQGSDGISPSRWTGGRLIRFHPERLRLGEVPQRGMYHLQSSVLWVGGPAAWGLPLRGSLGIL